MKQENPQKYSLQITTYEAIKNYAYQKNISLRRATFIAFENLKNGKTKCGFNLKSPLQFYSSLKRFKFSKMNHPKSFVMHANKGITGVTS